MNKKRKILSILFSCTASVQRSQLAEDLCEDFLSSWSKYQAFDFFFCVGKRNNLISFSGFKYGCSVESPPETVVRVPIRSIWTFWILKKSEFGIYIAVKACFKGVDFCTPMNTQ